MSRTEAANAGGGGQRGVVAVDSARARQPELRGWTSFRLPSGVDGKPNTVRPWVSRVRWIALVRPGSIARLPHPFLPPSSRVDPRGHGRRKSSGARVAAAGLVVSPRHLDGRMPLHGAAHPPIDIAGHSAHRRCMATAA